MKYIGLMRKLRHLNKKLVNQLFLFSAATYNLVRMRRLLALYTRNPPKKRKNGESHEKQAALGAKHRKTA